MNTENYYRETDLGNISLNPRGEYNPEESYEYLDLVVSEGGSYVCLAENGTTITGIPPESGKTTQYWQVITIPGSLTPEYIAMHDRVKNLSEQVEADAEEVRTSLQEVYEIEINVSNLQEQTRQSAEAAEQSKDSAAGYASSADASRQAAEESKQNIDAQVTGFDSHVAEKTEEAENDIEVARIAANKAIIAQQEQSVNEVARAGIEAISTARAAAQTATEKAQAADTSEKNAAASETAAKLSEENATKMAEQVATDKEQIAHDRTAVENAKQEMAGSVAQIDQNTQRISELKGDLDNTSKSDGRKANALKSLYNGSSICAENSIDGIIEELTITGNSNGVGILNSSSGKYEILVETKNRNHFNPEAFALDRVDVPGYGYTIFNGKRCFKFSDGGYYSFKYTEKFEPNTKYAIGFVIYRPDGNTKNVSLVVNFTDGTIKQIGGEPGYRRWINVDENKSIAYISQAAQYNQDAYLSIDECIILKNVNVEYDGGHKNDSIEYSEPQKSSFIVELADKLYDGDSYSLNRQLKSYDGETHIMNYQNANMSAIVNVDTEKKIIEIIKDSGFSHYHAIGDSITKGEFGGALGKQYWTYMNELCEIANTTADGVNSTCLSTGDGNATIESGCGINRLTNIPVNADLISIFMGTNDFGRGHALGTINDTETNTFYGALKYTCDYLLTNHSNACVFFITPIQRVDDANGTTKLSDYVSAIKEVCSIYSIPVLDLYSCLLCPKNGISKSKYFSTDGLHPNPEGHKKIGKRVAKFIKYELVN